MKLIINIFKYKIKVSEAMRDINSFHDEFENHIILFSILILFYFWILCIIIYFLFNYTNIDSGFKKN